MGRLFRKTTEFFGGGKPQTKQVVTIQPACRPRTGSQKVSIPVFDDNNLTGLIMATSSEETAMKNALETFFDGLDQIPNLPQNVPQLLQPFSFEVKFFKRDSTQAERDAFGMMDFPVYLRTTDSASFEAAKARELLSSHKIPQETIVMHLTDDEGSSRHDPVKPYEKMEEFINNANVFGMGVPGPYADDKNQSKCRKVGIIKVNHLISLIPQARRPERFLFVMKHELGHMLGLEHMAASLMADTYDQNNPNPNLTRGQIAIIAGSLTTLSQS